MFDKTPCSSLTLAGAMLALALTGCQDLTAAEPAVVRATQDHPKPVPATPPPTAVEAQEPAFRLEDILVGKVYEGQHSFLLASGEGIPKADRFWLLCGGSPEPVLVTSTGESFRDECCPSGPDQQDQAGCVEPDRCARMSDVRSLKPLDCDGHFLMAIPASFAKPKAWNLDLVHRRYELACPPDHHDEPIQDSPPSAPQKRLAKAWPELAHNPHLITSLSLGDRPPVHLIRGTIRTGEDTHSTWGVLTDSHLRKGKLTPMPGSKSTSQWHMLKHGCGVPFYALPSIVLGFELGKSGTRHLLVAEQMPSDRVRFSVWSVGSTGLKRVHEFGLHVPDPKFE